MSKQGERLNKKVLSASFGVWLGALALLGAFQPAIAAADPPPPDDGALQFRTIRGPDDPEAFSWTVTLSPSQTLTQIDDQHAVVEYDDHTVLWSIEAEPARDANGTSVPTSIAISEGNIVTLTVHHRAGNPAAGGAPFSYPITAGPAYTVGYSTVTVFIPESPPPPPLQARHEPCRVPKLKGEDLQTSRRVLLAANCRLGKAHRRGPTSAKGSVVVKQGSKPGDELPWGTRVWVTLGTTNKARQDRTLRHQAPAQAHLQPDG